MEYQYWKLVLRLLSLIAIGRTTLIEIRWAIVLYKQGLFFFIPVAAVVPAMSLWFFLHVKTFDPGPDPTSTAFYKAVRPDVVRCVVLSAVMVAVDQLLLY